MMDFRKEAILNKLRLVVVKLVEARKMLHETLVAVLALGADGDDMADKVITQLADLAATDPPLDNETLKYLSKQICKTCAVTDYAKCQACGIHIFVNTLKLPRSDKHE